MGIPNLRSQWFVIVIVAFLGVAVYQNLRLGVANRGLRSRVAEELSARVQVGDAIHNLRGANAASAHTEISDWSRGTLVLTVSPFCGVCKDNRDAANRLAARAREKGLNVVWVSRDRPSDSTEYFQSAAVADTVIADPTHGTYQVLRLGLVPQILVVDRTGIVRHSIAGAVDTAREENILRAVEQQSVK